MPRCLVLSRLPALLLCLLPAAVAAHGQSPSAFTCGTREKSRPAVATLTSASRYRASAGPAAPATGFDLVAAPETFAAGSCFGTKPFFFSIAEPDGNYQVTLTLGAPVASTVTVRAESRRLFVDRLQIPAGQSRTVSFNVNVRTADIAGAPADASKVRLKPREIGALDWDEKLTLEFNGDHPGVRAIAIKPVRNLPTVYLAGDSTVVDQDKEPWAAWGQMLPAFFTPRLVIANEAESGETIRSFVGERRLSKILSTIQPGDTLIVQFAHNDQKAGTPAATDFKGSLQKYLDAATQHGASMILVTSMHRRQFDAQGKIIDTLGGYPQATREFAQEKGLPLIDLNAQSKTLFEAMGPDGTLKAFVHYPANTFADQPEELKDDTHFNAYGAYELARAVVEQIRTQNLPLARFLRPDLPAFDPAHPDDPAKFSWAPSPLLSTEKPYGK